MVANAALIVTSDRHFDVLSTTCSGPRPIPPEEFIRQHLSGTLPTANCQLPTDSHLPEKIHQEILASTQTQFSYLG